MAKRFIDTELFDDPWFMDLSKDGKLFWLYLITKCNHAGIVELNEKLCKFQTDIKSMPTVTKELGNRLVIVSEGLFFLPKFIKFQYPNFPNSNVKQQKSAIEILGKYNLFSNGTLTLPEHLDKGYDNEHDNEHDNVNEGDNGINKNIPELNEFLEHGKELCKKAELHFIDYKYPIEAKYNLWVGDGWKDGHGKGIKNWKNKLGSVLPYLTKLKPEQGQQGIPNAVV